MSCEAPEIKIQGLSNSVYIWLSPLKNASLHNPLSQNAWYLICSKAQRPLKFF
jgi:hypothetical protein